MRPADLTRLVSLAAIWGASFLFVRIAAPAIGPVLTVDLRMLIAGATLAAYFRLIGFRVIDEKRVENEASLSEATIMLAGSRSTTSIRIPPTVTSLPCQCGVCRSTSVPMLITYQRTCSPLRSTGIGMLPNT